MTAPSWDAVVGPVSDAVRDDVVIPFAVEPLDVRGRVVRLGASNGHILAMHDYPTPVARLAGEAAAPTVLHATSLKIEGRFQLRTRGDGAIGAGRRLRCARPFARLGMPNEERRIIVVFDEVSAIPEIIYETT